MAEASTSTYKLMIHHNVVTTCEKPEFNNYDEGATD